MPGSHTGHWLMWASTQIAPLPAQPATGRVQSVQGTHRPATMAVPRALCVAGCGEGAPVLGRWGLCVVPQALTAPPCAPGSRSLLWEKQKHATLLPEAQAQRGGPETPGIPDVSGERRGLPQPVRPPPCLAPSSTTGPQGLWTRIRPRDEARAPCGSLLLHFFARLLPSARLFYSVCFHFFTLRQKKLGQMTSLTSRSVSSPR